MKLYYILKPLLGEENTRVLRVYRVKDNSLKRLLNIYVYKGQDVSGFTTEVIQSYILSYLALQPDVVEFIVL